MGFGVLDGDTPVPVQEVLLLTNEALVVDLAVLNSVLHKRDWLALVGVVEVFEVAAPAPQA